MDNKSKEERSKNMSHIRAKNTSIELKVRKKLFKDGFRYRVNVSSLPGKPDVVLPKYNTVIFINGCFWHRHNCKYANVPKSNIEYWNRKLAYNVSNDQKHYKELKSLGWNVMVLWECEIKHNFAELIKSVEKELLDEYYNS